MDAQLAQIFFRQALKLPYVGLSKQMNICLTRDQVTLADQQADPNSPLYSAKTFEQLGL